jgi:DNA-directed RNA polymerase beta subunit
MEKDLKNGDPPLKSILKKPNKIDFTTEELEKKVTITPAALIGSPAAPPLAVPNVTTTDETIQNIIHHYFADKGLPVLVQHHHDSYNEFIQNGIRECFLAQNPVKLKKNEKQLLYLGGKDGSKIYVGNAVKQDGSRNHVLFPNEARLRNLTYSVGVHYDIEVVTDYDAE